MPKIKTTRMTRQRKMILEELNKVSSHPTADQIYHIVRKRLPRISLGTVYRNLEMLAEMGLIRKLETAGSQRRYDGDISDHAHIRCSECGRIEDLPSAPKVNVTRAIKELRGYELEGYHIELRGLCPDCRGLKKNIH